MLAWKHSTVWALENSMVQGSYLAYAREINHRLGNLTRVISSCCNVTYSNSSWAAEDWAVCRNQDVKCFGVKLFWCRVEPGVYDVQLCSWRSNSTPSLRWLIRWKAVFVIALGSLSWFSDDGAQQGESWSRYRSGGHQCELWTFSLISVESFSMLQIGVKYTPGVWCSGWWSDLLAGSLAGWRGLSLTAFPDAFLCRKLTGELRGTYSVWKRTENVVD